MYNPSSHSLEKRHANLIDISHADLVAADIVATFYAKAHLQTILQTTLDFIQQQRQTGVALPYFAEVDDAIWLAKPKLLEVYITDLDAAQALNVESRGKDYATNILSYPSELPLPVLQAMPTIPLGELVICHEVVIAQAAQQNKRVGDHATHLLVHGILHLLGFDHELGDTEADEMEGFEIKIMQRLGFDNPYLDQ